jgi:hypothetical protein
VFITYEGEQMQLAGFARKMTDVRMQVAETNAKDDTVMHFDDFFDRMDNVFHNNDMLHLLTQVHEYLPMLDEMRKELTRLEEMVHGLAQQNEPGSNSREIGSAIRAAIVDIGRQIAGFAAFSAECDQYYRTMTFFLKSSFGFAEEIIKRMNHAMRMAGVPLNEVPEEWKSVNTQIRSAVDEIQVKAIGHAATSNIVKKLRIDHNYGYN